MSNNSKSGFGGVLNRAVHIFILNILWLICSLPVITVGAATCAAFYVSLKIIDDEEVSIFKMFFKSFKMNFKQGTVMWCITAPCIFACYKIWNAVLNGDPNFIVVVGAIIFTVLVICLNLYAYPYIARYSNTLKNIIRNSIALAMLYFRGTVMLTAVIVAEAFLLSYNLWTVIFGIFIGPVILFYSISTICKSIFIKIEENGGMIIPPTVTGSDDEESDDDDLDDDEFEEVDAKNIESDNSTDESENKKNKDE